MFFGFFLKFHVVQSGVSKGVWFYDNTHRPGPKKQRNYAAYSPLQQDILNEHLQKGAWQFEMPDARGWNATINLEAMEQLCYGQIRYLELRDESGRVLFSWDMLNEGQIEYDDNRSHFDNLACFFYFTDFYYQLRFQ